MKKVFLVLASSIALVGCASGDYTQYAKAQENIAASQAVAKAIEKAAMYNALAQIAASGSETSKVAAAMGIATSNNQAQQQGTQISAPGPDPLLQWASVLVPGITQMYSVNQQVKLGTVQSNNQTTLGVVQSNNTADVQKNTNATMQGIAGLIPQTIDVLPLVPMTLGNNSQ